MAHLAVRTSFYPHRVTAIRVSVHDPRVIVSSSRFRNIIPAAKGGSTYEAKAHS